jgi:FlaA1/EpsC-like NDP-sugar epimerase
MRFLITGATGTLGRKVIDKLLANYDHQILGISRDEQKQRTMPKHPNLKMRLADVRTMGSLWNAVDCDLYGILHFAALKCVDTLEANPAEAIETNVIGTQNIVTLGRNKGCRVVLTSTDKAVDPINTYGHTKALAEKLVMQREGNVVCRYGNVLGSRGSVVPSFITSLLHNTTINITHPEMTRFWLTIDQAADLVIRHMLSTHAGGLAIPSVKAAKVYDVGVAIAKILGFTDYEVKTIGIRPGEKMHETLEPGISSDTCEQFTEDELKDLLTPLVNDIMEKRNC